MVPGLSFVSTAGSLRIVTIAAGRGRWSAAAALVAAGAAAAAVLGRAEPPGPASPQPVTRSVSLRVSARIPVPRAPQGIVVTDDAVWVTAAGSLRVVKIDPDTEREIAGVGFGAVPAGITVADGAVWVGFAEGGEIVRLDENRPGEGGDPIMVGQTPQAVAAAEDASGVWVAALNEPAVVLVDASTGRVAQRVDLEDRFPAAVSAGFGKVWVPDVVANTLLVIDASGGPPEEVRVGSSPTSVATGEGAVWVGNFDSETVSRFDPEAGRVTGGVDVGGPVGGVAVGGGYVWATVQGEGRIVAIDPHTGEIAGSVAVGRVPQGIAVAPDGSVWAVVQGEDEVVRVEVR